MTGNKTEIIVSINNVKYRKVTFYKGDDVIKEVYYNMDGTVEREINYDFRGNVIEKNNNNSIVENNDITNCIKCFSFNYKEFYFNLSDYWVAHYGNKDFAINQGAVNEEINENCKKIEEIVKSYGKAN